ncbi:MAG: hypothetical protein QOD55_1188 [Solirubrobacteraceae bacterium]|jgi:hypothetical protein|nr:hypothetical protein [Solirubrobacteraceae bacterium]MEA2289191.1 hypothetical protein [Solirubrobacteraceae bacterium]
MAPTEPPDPADPLAGLREQIRATREAAERLGEEARVPPQGWAAPPRPGEPSAQDDLAALLALLQALRGLVPAELQQQVTEVIRQVLQLVRALIDRWLEHLDGERGAEPDVEDIPIA